MHTKWIHECCLSDLGDTVTWLFVDKLTAGKPTHTLVNSHDFHHVFNSFVTELPLQEQTTTPV